MPKSYAWNYLKAVLKSRQALFKVVQIKSVWFRKIYFSIILCYLRNKAVCFISEIRNRSRGETGQFQENFEVYMQVS